MEYAKVDKRKKKISQDNQKSIAEYDDTVVEDEAAKVSAQTCSLRSCDSYKMHT